MNYKWSEVNSHYLLKNVKVLQQFLQQQWQHQQNPDRVAPPNELPLVEIPELSPPTALEQVCTTFNLSAFEVYLLLMGVGVAVFPDHGENEIELTQHADHAMYQAKNSGRDSVQLFTAVGATTH